MNRRFRTWSASSLAAEREVLVNMSNDGYFGHSVGA